ncbi:MAG TPA: hypothetical protein GX505_10910 [Clostridiales bacterium]|nr:hypothetical protein [Clostridiales bacterium]
MYKHGFGRKSNVLIAVCLFVVLLACAVVSPSENFIGGKSESGSAGTMGSYDKTPEFVLPVSLPDNQMLAGVIITQAKNTVIQTSSRWISFLFIAGILLYGCMVPKRHQYTAVNHIIAKPPEISLRIGGHAPPVCTAV